MIIEVKYRALQNDNHQGGSGNPFESRLVYTEHDELKIGEMYANAIDNIKGIESQWVSEIQFISLEVVRDFNE